eukprot:1185780-Prorocentrum_minimum.AAC.2
MPRRQVASLPPGTYLRNPPIRGINDDEWLLPVHQNFMKVNPPPPPVNPPPPPVNPPLCTSNCTPSPAVVVTLADV